MKILLALVLIGLTGCATTAPVPSPFERCMATLKGVEYVGTKIESANWCAKNHNGGIAP